MGRLDDWRSVLADLLRVATRRGRAAAARFSIEGTRLHERALRAGVRIESALVGRTYAEACDDRSRDLLEQLQGSGCVVHVVADDEVSALTEGRSSGAIVGLAVLPEAVSLAEILAAPKGRAAALLVAVDVEDPGNVGALIRTALALGADGFVGVGISDPFHPKAVRTSMGSLFKLPALAYESSAELLADLRSRGVETFGAVSRGGVRPAELETGASPMAVLLGSEAFGLSPEVLGAVDALVSVPTVSRIDSLSVNAAAAILLHELIRFR